MNSKPRHFSFFMLLFLIGIVSLLSCESQNYSSVLGPIHDPEGYSTNEEAVEMGKELFFDTRLSADNSIACATCHKPESGFNDERVLSGGINNHHTERNTPTLLNIGYHKQFMRDGSVQTLEMQALVPLRDTNEMGNDMKVLINKLKAIPHYNQLAKKIFEREFDAFVLTRSLAAFERTLIADKSRWDLFNAGETNQLSASEQRGWKLFSSQLYCAKCHPAPHFTTYELSNNGLYPNYDTIADKGRFRVAEKRNAIGQFKIPTLRNLGYSAPYMHDGSMRELDQVIEHYSKGGSKHPNQSPIIQPFALTQQEKKDLLAFLLSLDQPIYTEP